MPLATIGRNTLLEESHRLQPILKEQIKQAVTTQRRGSGGHNKILLATRLRMSVLWELVKFSNGIRTREPMNSPHYYDQALSAKENKHTPWTFLSWAILREGETCLHDYVIFPWVYNFPLIYRCWVSFLRLLNKIVQIRCVKQQKHILTALQASNPRLSIRGFVFLVAFSLTPHRPFLWEPSSPHLTV